MKHELREYQKNILSSIERNGNTLVVLPTGLGKTHIALGLLEKTKKKSLFLTPTKPLAHQHHNTIKEVLGLPEEDCALAIGECPPKKRKALYARRAISSTPQTINNDMEKGIFPTNEIGLVVFDEAHRAVGDYAYVKIARKLSPNTLIVALTASPGGDITKIKEVLTNLKIRNIEARTHTDPDVLPYIHKMNKIWVPVDLGPNYEEAKGALKQYVSKTTQSLKKLGFNPHLFSKRAFLEQRQNLFNMKHPLKYRAIYLSTCLLHALHLQELLETQGKAPVLKYSEKISHSQSKSARAVLNAPEVRRALSLVKESADHPKMEKLLSLAQELSGKKIIIFVQYRDQIESIISQLGQRGIHARPFMGKRENFTRKMQEETIDAFRRGEFNVLVASSIGEEGLDIPAVDAVVFFEPIPSEIRTIQRRGRAGRFKEGSVYILMTRNSQDQYYYWASHKRERKMKEALLSLQSGFRAAPLAKESPPKQQGQNKITDFFN
ncbi:MAG: helicase-related protein [Candidatus Bilamarchaeaceae archaeon]